jgi:hypothetical protein
MLFFDASDDIPAAAFKNNSVSLSSTGGTNTPCNVIISGRSTPSMLLLDASNKLVQVAERNSHPFPVAS